MQKHSIARENNAAKSMKVALVVTMVMGIAAASGILPAFAADAALGQVMNIVINIVTTAAKYIGAVIALWGFFQIVLAFRREDSEAISKQIVTIVVGGILVGFGIFVPEILGALGI